ncbi:MAG: YfhO family protein [Bacillota bacterium]|nr:YfhO family protein [Bacillota bacterium]MDP4170234.1 YfhO family protein [Bacillota bacterium]
MFKFGLTLQAFASFLIPPLLFGLAMAFFGIYPFGPYTLLTTDMDSQYIQYFKHFYDVLTKGQSIFYTWNAGMGLNFMSFIAYYLASPTSVLILLFNSKHLPEAIILITLLKIGLSGLTMNIYLSKTIPMKKLYSLMFSIMYSLMGFSTAYSFDIMWLEGIYLLPLLLLGVERLLKENKFIFLIVVLAFSFISNFYISYMMGIFTFLYFLARYFTMHWEKKRGIFLRKFALFALATAIAAGMSMFLILPTAMALRWTPKQPLNIETLENFKVNLLDVYMKLFPGYVDSLRRGVPNLYPGLLATLIFPIFFISKKIMVKEKLIFGLLLIFFLFSFEIPFLNLAWHGFDSPNFFPYRYSFLLTFLIIYLAIRAFHVMDRKSIWVIIPFFLLDLLLFPVFKMRNSHYITDEIPTVSSILLTAYFILLILKCRVASRKKWISISLFILVCTDMGINAFFTMKSIDYQFAYNHRKNYLENSSDIEKVVEYTKNKDRSFYRTESTLNRNLNDPLRYGYNGISHFSSLSYAGLHQYLHDLGYTTLGSNLWASNNGSTVVTDSLLGIKYMISGPNFNRIGYKQTVCSNNVCMYKNNNALPIGYFLNKTDFNLSSSNPFFNQSNVFGTESYFQKVMPDHVAYLNLSVSMQKRHLHIEKIVKKSKAFIQYRFKLKGDQQLYTLFSADRWNHSEVFVDGHPIGTYPSVFNNRILDLGAYSNKEIAVLVKLLGNQLTIKNPVFYTLDTSKYKKRITQLRAQELHVKKWSNTQITGEVTSVDGGLLFLSIPYDPGWSANVDGKPVETTNIHDAFLGIQLKGGHHRIQLSYLPPGFKTGAVVSLISLLLFVLLFFNQRKRRIRDTSSQDLY